MILKNILLKLLFKIHCRKDTEAQATEGFQSRYTYPPPMWKMGYGEKE